MPSTATSRIAYPAAGTIAYACAAPAGTSVTPAGVTVPPVPAVAVIGNTAWNVAAMVWSAVTLENVYDAIAPCETPSTATSRITYPVAAEIE